MIILLGKRLKFSVNVLCIQSILQVGQSYFELEKYFRKCYLLKITFPLVINRNSVVIYNNHANPFFSVELDFRDLEVQACCNLCLIY